MATAAIGALAGDRLVTLISKATTVKQLLGIIINT